MLPISICGIIFSTPSNCGKINVLINLLESSHGICFENVYVYSKSLQQPKYQYLKNLLAPKEIGYFTFSNNNVLLLNEVKFHFCLQWHDMRQARHNQRVLCDGLTSVDVDCFYLCQIYAKILKHLIMQICWNRMVSIWNMYTMII